MGFRAVFAGYGVQQFAGPAISVGFRNAGSEGLTIWLLLADHDL